MKVLIIKGIGRNLNLHGKKSDFPLQYINWLGHP